MPDLIRIPVDSVFAILQRLPGPVGDVPNPVGLISASGDAGGGRRAALIFVFAAEGAPVPDGQYDEGEGGANALLPMPVSAMAAVYEIAKTRGAWIAVARDLRDCAIWATPLAYPVNLSPEEALRGCPWWPSHGER